MDGEVVGRAESMGVVFTQHAAEAGEGVLAEGSGLAVLAQRGQAGGEVVGRAECVEVILAVHVLEVGEAVTFQMNGIAETPKGRQRLAEVVAPLPSQLVVVGTGQVESAEVG
jgi:hypothetical protein